MSLVYGLAELYKGGVSLGWIEKGSFDMGGKKGEATDVYAEQIPDAPVEVIAQSNSTINPTFNLIQLNYENFQKTLGGSLVTSGTGDDLKVIGWTAPEDLVQLRDEYLIKYRSGQETYIPDALLLANFGGKVTLTETTKIECELRTIKTTGSSSYGVYEAGTITEEEA